MYFNKEMLKRISPPDLYTVETNEWYRDDTKTHWQNNNLWFYETQQHTTHLVIADIESGMVVLRDFRWDYINLKWVTAKAKLVIRLLDFYKFHWYRNRQFKNYKGSYMYNALVKTEPPKNYAFEMCLRIYRRIQEFSYYLHILVNNDKDLLKQFAADMITDFGAMETLASICMFSDYIARKLMSTITYSQTIEKARQYMRSNGFDVSYYNESIIDLRYMTDYDVDIISELLPIVYKGVVKV